MRRKRELVLSFFDDSCERLPQTVLAYREKYKGISRILDQRPEILDAVHRDLSALSEGGRGGREADFTSETLLRALLVMMVEGLSYRDAVIRIAESEFLQDFLRTRKKAVMDHTFLNRAFKAIRPETWKRVNELLATGSVAANLIDPSVVRTDTTVVEANIHWPTDSGLLWDTWRVASRIQRRGRSLLPEGFRHRFHDKKIKRLHLRITRYSASTSKRRLREVRRCFRQLIARTAWIVQCAEQFCQIAANSSSSELVALGVELAEYLPAMRQTVEQASRRAAGETVPASERVFSIFEPHTELIKRGRRHKPVEFGHTVLLCQTEEKFITDYEVYERRQADCKLTSSVLDRHEALFGAPPEVLAGDKGFCPDADEYDELQDRVATLAIPRRMRDLADATMSAWQCFRAGIEGTISGLKRAFRLARCYFRTFKSFQASIGLGVFCHNLVLLAKAGET